MCTLLPLLALHICGDTRLAHTCMACACLTLALYALCTLLPFLPALHAHCVHSYCAWHMLALHTVYTLACCAHSWHTVYTLTAHTLGTLCTLLAHVHICGHTHTHAWHVIVSRLPLLLCTHSLAGTRHRCVHFASLAVHILCKFCVHSWHSYCAYTLLPLFCSAHSLASTQLWTYIHLAHTCMAYSYLSWHTHAWHVLVSRLLSTLCTLLALLLCIHTVYTLAWYTQVHGS